MIINKYLRLSHFHHGGFWGWTSFTNMVRWGTLLSIMDKSFYSWFAQIKYKDTLSLFKHVVGFFWCDFECTNGVWCGMMVCGCVYVCVWWCGSHYGLSNEPLDRANWLDQISEYSDQLLDWNSSCSTKAISLDRSSEGLECTLFSCTISFTGMF